MEDDKLLEVNNVYTGRSEVLMQQIRPGSIALSFWSPPYFVGKEYEKDATYGSWTQMLSDVITQHTIALKPGGFMVVNIADIKCFADESIPRFQAMNEAKHKSPITREMVLAAKRKYPELGKHRLAELLGCSEQTVDRRLNGNNIRGGKYATQTRVKLTGGIIESAAYDAGLYLYDHRIWVKDPAWANSRWTSNTLKAVDEYEDLYFFWKPGQTIVNRRRLTSEEWKEWGQRGIWNIKSVRANDDHEAKFPIQLAERVVRLLSDPSDVVLDPFLGSGTTALAAALNARSYIGIEKEQKYAKLAEKNISEGLQNRQHALL